MKIQQFEVSGLHDNEESITLNFHDDLNILSGRNGAGKTTILKLMWYLISGNFDKAVAEIKFNSAILTTDKYQLNVEVNYDEKENPLKSTLILKNTNILKNFEDDEVLTQLITSKNNKEIAWFLTQYIDSSFFMPTFRMIEGGFTTEKYDIQHDVLKEFYLDINKDNDYND
ncbi:AAA family ATPase, partial [Acinetobacter baumannii]